MIPKNDADYPVCKGTAPNRVWCPLFTVWKAMINRCYSAKIQAKSPTYVGCSVVPEWHSFMAFRAWMLTQDWEGKQLDKDILLPGNKLYGPSTCVFVSQHVNSLLLDCAAARGEHPLGVCWNKAVGKFQANVSVHGRGIYLGVFKTAAEAHAAWQLAKAATIDEAAFVQTDPRVAAALYQRADALRADWINGEETINHTRQGEQQ